MLDPITLKELIPTTVLDDSNAWVHEFCQFVSEAEKKGMNLQSRYDPGLVFSPKELVKEWWHSHFIWGVVNWRMVPRRIP